VFDWTVIVAANNEEVLKHTLLRSPDIANASSLLVQRGYSSAGQAYNAGIGNSCSEILVFPHQDVYLPTGWADLLRQWITRMADQDPDWGVIGLYGVNGLGSGIGHVYSTGLRRFVGQSFSDPIQVRSLDEMILILRRSSGLYFDVRLPGFHLYATDICLEAEARGMRNYALPCFALHNSNGINRLPWSFWRAYLYLRTKWKDRLPIFTPCTKITSRYTPVIKQIVQGYWSSVRNRNRPGCRVNDPERLYSEQLAPILQGKC
jgi:hypothetical protein